MKLLIINPNISESLSDLIEQEARLSISNDTELTVLTAPFGVAYIETRAEAQIAGYAVMQLAAENYMYYDAIIVAAFGDPGLDALREILPIPVIGMTEAALASASQLGGKVSIIAISQRIQAWYKETVEKEGFSLKLASIRALDETLADISLVQENQGTRLIQLANEAIKQDGADVLILAGAPLAGLARSVRSQLPVPALDGVSCAVKQAEVLVQLYPDQSSRLGSYASPPKKGCKGLSTELSNLIGREIFVE
ncbi:aspartate/glutamate racemase family protein [Psychromonas sp. 14N.309.X.WAT.B.A12]|uniref:aspartate/glutamate racemase family protein n=1 Tax=Psychromonas sp. 14N.309.X.WAT.B.A12 TaxID=2998322 RepID=UPI0025AFB63C|nr:aspartate/glutamate racemase family protein [Psychromonas sp. 14N.309.X.WAT.B.A12]MDN2663268.1 aspartate/glutamate racemase family protein [Psychromonas sp. 14N.309.X.WAT.B.A12]